MNRKTPCGLSWLSVRRWVRERDPRARKWVFALGWVMGIRWYMNMMRRHKVSLREVVDHELDKQMLELIEKTRLEMLQ